MEKQLSFRQISAFVWNYFKRRPVWLIIVILSLSLQAASDLFWPYLIGQFTEKLSISVGSSAAFWSAWKYILIIGLNSAVYWTLKIVNHFSYDRFLKMPAMRDAAVDTFASIQKLSTDWHENSFSGATVRKITRGVYAIEQFSDRFYDHFLPLGFLAIGLNILIVLRWPIVALTITMGALVYLASGIFLSSFLVTAASRAHAAADTKMGASLADSLSGQSTVRSFAKEAAEVKRFRVVAKEWFERFWRNYFALNTVTLIQSMVSVVLQLSTFTVILWIWSGGGADLSDVIFVIMGFYALIDYLKGIDSAVREVQVATRNLEDMALFSHISPQVLDQPQARSLQIQRGEIIFDNVSFRYPKQRKWTYRNLSLTLHPGERIALVGHSGGGKSTFVKLLQRLYDVTTGAIRIDGHNIAQVTQASLRQSIALVPQDPILFHRSLAENIAYARPQASQKEIERAAKMAHAHEFISALPHGYKTLVGERGIKLSGGERQRVAIARAILADCPILILDEATSSLDSESERLIQDALKNLLKNRTSIIIAHRLSTIKTVDRIIVFADGRIVEDGTHRELLKRKTGIYQQMFRLQAGGFLQE